MGEGGSNGGRKRGRKRGMEGGREGRRKEGSEGGSEGWREGGRERWREVEREEGREGERKGWRERGRKEEREGRRKGERLGGRGRERGREVVGDGERQETRQYYFIVRPPAHYNRSEHSGNSTSHGSNDGLKLSFLVLKALKTKMYNFSMEGAFVLANNKENLNMDGCL